MPTKTVKKKPSLSKARKPAPKKKAPVALTKPAVRKAKKAAPTPVQAQGKRGFMWKLLEEKKARQMQSTGGKPMNSANPFERGQLPTGVNQQGFGRFNGPRRKAA